MAVIIPMAKMPNNCEDCDLKGLCSDYWTKIREEYTRPSWCQLDDLDATTFCGVPMEEAVKIMQMYKRGELVHLADRKTELQTEYEKYRKKIRALDPHKDWFEDDPQMETPHVCKICPYYEQCNAEDWRSCRYDYVSGRYIDPQTERSNK